MRSTRSCDPLGTRDVSNKRAERKGKKEFENHADNFACHPHRHDVYTYIERISHISCHILCHRIKLYFCNIESKINSQTSLY